MTDKEAESLAKEIKTFWANNKDIDDNATWIAAHGNKVVLSEPRQGKTPMSFADEVIKEVHGNEEMLVDIVYFILAFLNKYGEKKRELYEES